LVGLSRGIAFPLLVKVVLLYALLHHPRPLPSTLSLLGTAVPPPSARACLAHEACVE
jgi:hypothetical protein